MIYALVFSLMTNFLTAALITVVLLPFQVSLYYLSRFKDRTTLSLNLYCLLFYIFFIFSYRISSGITGSSLLSLCLVHFLSLAAAPRKEYIPLTVVNLTVVAALLTTEYLDPNFIQGGYTDKKQQFIDIASTYAVNMILILVSLAYIINNYTKEKEKAEERTMLLDELHEEKSRLISLISHDYHTPLNSMKKYLEILGTYDLKPDEKRMLETEVSQSVTNTQNLLLNLLDLTNEKFKSQKAKEYFVVQDQLKETVQAYIDIAKGKGIQFDSLIPESLRIFSNPYHLNVILRNLINNAVKFCPKNSRITLSYQQKDDLHEFSVTDNGTGIADATKQAIVEGWENQSGTFREGGMGLILSKKFTEALMGTLSFTSQKGSGTTFYVRIPL